VSAVILLLLDLIALSSEAKAATLKPETIAAWDHADDKREPSTGIRDWAPGGRNRRAVFEENQNDAEPRC
jgi:hypothetical protein